MFLEIIKVKFIPTLNKIKFFLFFFLLFSSVCFSYPVNPTERKNIVKETLETFESPSQNKFAVKKNKPLYPGSLTAEYFSERKEVIKKTLDFLEIGIVTGYLSGKTSFEINFPVDGYRGRSRLDFPLGNGLIGGNFSLRIFGDFKLNLEGYTQLWEKARGYMEDKDWINGFLFSSTESDAKAKIVIWDVNFLYYFLEEERIDKEGEGKAAALLGFKHEKFGFDIFGIRDVLRGGEYYPGRKVLEYEVRYKIPYLGIDAYYTMDIESPSDQLIEKYGVGMKVWFSPFVEAKDYDDHVLRYKELRGEADGWGYSLGLNGFLKARNNWEFWLGLDYLRLKTKGKQSQYWYGDDPAGPGNETGTTISDIDLKIESHQVFWWLCLKYKF